MTFRRFRIRTLMFAIVIVALLLTGPPTAWRWYTYRYRARASTAASLMYLRMACRSEGEDARGFRELAAWADGMARKYRDASSRPWQTVSGDPSYLATGNIRGEPEWSVTHAPKRR